MKHDIKRWKAGDEVTIGYMGYTVDAVVLGPHTSRYGFSGWWRVRETRNNRDGHEWPEGGPAAPEYEAAAEFIVKRGEKPPDPALALFLMRP
jgi:hypothetical protein